jgi:hypothetical protein
MSGSERIRIRIHNTGHIAIEKLKIYESSCMSNSPLLLKCRGKCNNQDLVLGKNIPPGTENFKILNENAIKIRNESVAMGVKTFELYDKDFKRPSKSRETVPLNISAFLFLFSFQFFFNKSCFLFLYTPLFSLFLSTLCQPQQKKNNHVYLTRQEIIKGTSLGFLFYLDLTCFATRQMFL